MQIGGDWKEEWEFEKKCEEFEKKVKNLKKMWLYFQIKAIFITQEGREGGGILIKLHPLTALLGHPVQK